MLHADQRRGARQITAASEAPAPVEPGPAEQVQALHSGGPSPGAAAPLLSHWTEPGGGTPAATGGRPPAHEQVGDKVSGLDAQAAAGDAVLPGIVQEDYRKLLSLGGSGDAGGFAALVGTFSPDYREKMKGELIRHHKFDRLPLSMQAQLSPKSPYHQESKIDAGGAIQCTTAVRIEGVSAQDALRALAQTDWKEWWATSTTSGPPPSFDFVPEAPLKAIPGFHLHVQMGAPVPEGKNWRLPAKLVGTFSGDAEMYIESVGGGVVVHDTWMGVKLSNFTMEHAGGVSFWTSGHLDALRGAMFGGMLGATGFAGLRRHLLGQKR
jgi:hypothetical protein